VRGGLFLFAIWGESAITRPASTGPLMGSCTDPPPAGDTRRRRSFPTKEFAMLDLGFFYAFPQFTDA